MVIATGCTQLDRMLGGGIPDERAVLVTGGPGVGKSTLAMQFLQAGLAQDERCLYISTEQTTEELRTSFAPFNFDLDHPNLTTTSLHAMPDTTIEESSTGLALHTLQGDEAIDGNFRYPFESEYITEFLEQFAPCDRVVLDSASGLGVISDNRHRFQRVILELIRMFTDTFGATALFTAESLGSSALDTPESSDLSSLLQFTTHGVIRLWWEEVHGSRRRFLEVVKMRGVGHDTRRMEIGFADDGIYLAPKHSAANVGVDEDAIIQTEIEGLDEMSGGLVRGHSILLEYDGRTMIDSIVSHIANAALANDMAIWIIPSPVYSADRFERLVPGDWDTERLLDDNLLFVLDGFSAWQKYHDHPNVFPAPTGLLGSLFRRSTAISVRMMKYIARTVGGRREKPLIGVTYTEAFLRWLDPDEVKEVYYWAREELALRHDTGFFIHNPATMEKQLAEFFNSDAVQVFEAQRSRHGLHYLHLNKSPTGDAGSTGVIEQGPDGQLAIRGARDWADDA